jgi:large subunit ribosomal protein L21
MYAIVKVGGKQYRVEKGDSLLVDRMREDEGAKVSLEPLLYRSDEAVFDAGELEKVKVEAVIAGHERGVKLRVFKFKPKRGYRRTTGHRSELTRLEISDIKLLSRKPAKAPAAEKPSAPSREKPTAAAEKKPAASKAAASKAGAAADTKAAGSKAAEKKPAAGKAKTARKPAEPKAAGARGGGSKAKGKEDDGS